MTTINPNEPIAVVGLATRFANDVGSPDKLWEFLLQGKSAMTPFPADRMNSNAHYHEDREHAGTAHIKGGHFINDISSFDAGFFGIANAEAILMDPQQRLLLESVYEALENSGTRMEDARGSNTSVYVGSFCDDYRAILSADPEQVLKHKITGVYDSILANRVSWFFDLKGNSVTIDTACSSSLVAIHMACQNLRLGESRMSIACGASVICDPHITQDLTKLGALSPDSLSYSFDHRANGYSRGEGVGTILLKRLSDAVHDGDTIRGVIHASGANQDGRTKGIFTPSADAQAELIRDTYKRAGLGYEHTSYVEAHGTGTPVGDPTEVKALVAAFENRLSNHPLYIGAVKSALGHTEGAAGVLGVIKAVLVVESGIIPPNVNFEKPNPEIKTEEWNVVFPTTAVPWPQDGPRFASVNSFGFGGTNAHVVVGDAYHSLIMREIEGLHQSVSNPPTQDEVNNKIQKAGVLPVDNTSPSRVQAENDKDGRSEESQDSDQVFALSTFDEGGIERLTKQLIEYLSSKQPFEGDETEQKFLNDLSYTLSAKRTAFGWRAACKAASVDELIKAAGQLNPIKARLGSSVAFVFTGQGAQWRGMGRALLRYPVYRQSLDAATEFLHGLGSTWSAIDRITSTDDDFDINDPVFAHPLCTILQVAAVDLLRSWNMIPTTVVGHSSGEIAAAYAAGIIGRKAAWKIAYYRGVVSKQLTNQGGSMMAVRLREEALLDYITRFVPDGDLTVACKNSPTNFTLSGSEKDLDRLREALERDGKSGKKLSVRNAYHSSEMEAAAGQYLELMGSLPDDDKLAPSASTNMVSSVTGKRVDPRFAAQPAYWTTNLVFPVHFSQAIRTMCVDGGIREVVEIGPHSVLKSAIKETVAEYDIDISYSNIVTRNVTSGSLILKTATGLWEKGFAVDLQRCSDSCTLSHGETPQLLTSLPPYPFNHSTSHWKESRRSRHYRLGEHPRTELLGKPVSDWNANEPTWRNFLRVGESPWLSDHVVSGQIIYPAVGQVAMAVEAAKQMTKPNENIRGFRLRDVQVMAALVIPDTVDGIETMISLKPVMESSVSPSKTWRHFHIYSHNVEQNEWTLHSTGQVAAEVHRKRNTVDYDRECAVEQQQSKQLLTQSATDCRTSIDFNQIYERTEKIGMIFGPTFKNISNTKVKADGVQSAQAVTTIRIPDISQVMPQGFLYPHVVHPAMLDSVMHSVYASLMSLKGTGTKLLMFLPRVIGDAWIASDIETDPGHEFVCHNTMHQASPTTLHIGITLWDKDSSVIKAQFHNVEFIHVDTTDTSEQRRVASHCIDWKPDIDALPKDHFKGLCTEDEEVDHFGRLELTAALFIKLFLPELQKVLKNDNLPPHFHKYVGWLQRKNEEIEAHSHPHLDYAALEHYLRQPQSLVELYDQVSKSSANGRLCVQTGKSLSRILSGEIDPLQLMFETGDLMNEVYREVFETGNLPAFLGSYLDIVGHQRSGLRVLEIGAGTGSTTSHILRALSPLGSGQSSKIKDFFFTDVSAGFMEGAANRFDSWKDIMHYQTFDVEQDPTEQGLDTESFDIIIAGNVLHATKALGVTLRNVRSLLKPHGRLILHELVTPEGFFLPFSFGLLPGWWLSSDSNRQMGPLLDEENWDSVLRLGGFTGATHILADGTSERNHLSSVIVAEAANEFPSWFPRTTITVIDLCTETGDEDLSGSELRDCMHKTYGLGESRCISLDTAQENIIDESILVVVSNPAHSFWENLSHRDFENIKYVLNTGQRILWVSLHDDNPSFAVSTGLLRTARSEGFSPSRNLVTLDARTDQHSACEIKTAMNDIFNRQFLIRTAEANEEYRLEGGRLLTGRLNHLEAPHDYMERRDNNGEHVEPVLRRFDQPPRRGLKLHVQSARRLDSLVFVDDPTAMMALDDTQIEVEIKAAGINFRDMMVGMGEIHDNCLGVEGSGVISNVGSGVSGFDIGDRVLVLADPGRTGTIQTFCRTKAELAVKIPDTMTFETASSLAIIGCTVIHSLGDVARLTAGETILIHAGSGGTGQTAIQYAQAVGAEVFTTVSSDEKKKLVMDLYQIPEDHIFYSRDGHFAKAIKLATGGKGVDVVLNSLGGELLRQSWNCIAVFGRFIELGKRDIRDNGRLEMQPFSKCATFAAVDFMTLMALNPAAAARLLQQTLDLYNQGKIAPPSPITTMEFSEVGDALRKLQTGRSTGKMVLVKTDDDVVPVLPTVPSSLRLRGDASYVIAGGLGGLGRTIAKWMAQRGARHLVFLSRSGRIENAVEELFDDLNLLDCQATVVKCDITDSKSLQSAINDIPDLPPIKGCIQAAMQLNDASLATMTSQDFNAAISPKVQGSWNLHLSMPRDLDFFVMLSSICGIIGNRGQANYAAGNTYQDELARYRMSQGLPSYSIDLGVVTSAGYVAENLNDKRNLGATLSAGPDITGVHERDIFNVLEYCLHSDNSGDATPRPHQIIVGLDTADILQPKAKDTDIPSYKQNAMWTHLLGDTPKVDQPDVTPDNDKEKGDTVSDHLRTAQSLESAVELILQGIQTKLSTMLSIQASDVDPTKKLSDYGVDSLVAVEFRAWMSKELGADIPVLELVGSDSIKTVCGRITQMSRFVGDNLKGH